MIPHWHMSHVSLFLLVTQVLNIIAMKVLKQKLVETVAAQMDEPSSERFFLSNGALGLDEETADSQVAAAAEAEASCAEEPQGEDADADEDLVGVS